MHLLEHGMISELRGFQCTFYLGMNDRFVWNLGSQCLL